MNLVLEWSDWLTSESWEPLARSIAGGAIEVLGVTELDSEDGEDVITVRLWIPIDSTRGFIRWSAQLR